MDAYRIHDMLEDVSEAASTELAKGTDSVNTKEFGEVVDMIKDLTEAEKNKWQSCYYKSIVEAMENSEYGEDYDWSGPDEDRMGYPRGRDSMGRFTSRRGYDGMRNQRGYDQRMMDSRMMDYESGRMGYSNGAYGGGQRGMSSSPMRSSRYGYSHDDYMEKKSALNQNDPKRMKMIEDHMDDLYGMFKEEVQDMSPEEKQMWKTKLNKIINM
jgi:hypothetical protein